MGPRKDFLTEIRIRHSHRSSELIETIRAGQGFKPVFMLFEVLTPPNPDYRELIKTFDIPSLLVIGGVGAVVSSRVAAELAGLNQRLEVVQIKEAGHGIPLMISPSVFRMSSKLFYIH